jgi:hypothetical protein
MPAQPAKPKHKPPMWKRCSSALRRHHEAINVFTAGFVAVLSLFATVFSVYQAREGLQVAKDAALINQRAALDANMPFLQTTIAQDSQSVTIENAGNGPAIIYYAAYQAGGTIAKFEGPFRDRSNLELVMGKARLAIFGDPSFQPRADSSILLGVISPNGSKNVLKFTDPLNTEQQNTFFTTLADHLQVKICYVNITVDITRELSIGNKPNAFACPSPPANLRPTYPKQLVNN